MTTEDQLRAKLATAEDQVAMLRDVAKKAFRFAYSCRGKLSGDMRDFRIEIEALTTAALSSEQPPILAAIETAALALEGSHPTTRESAALALLEPYRTKATAAPTEYPKCRHCDVTMVIGEAIPPAMTDHGEAVYHECAPRVRVWKCPSCGHSFTQHAQLP